MTVRIKSKFLGRVATNNIIYLIIKEIRLFTYDISYGFLKWARYDPVPTYISPTYPIFWLKTQNLFSPG